MMEEKCLLMALYVVLCMSVCPARGGPPTSCDADKRWDYTQEVLAETNFPVNDIAVSHRTGNVYVALGSTLLIMKERNITENVDIEDISSVAVDNTLPRIYICSTNGLYIYDEMSGSVTKVTQVQHVVYNIFVPYNIQEVYVVTWPERDVYRYRHNFTERTKINIDDKISRLVVDKHDNYFYATGMTLMFVTKIQLNGHNGTTQFNRPFATLAVDNTGRVFGTSFYNDIYTEVHRLKTDGTSESVATLDFRPMYMSFDKDNNVVFGTYDEHKIIKFKYNK